MPEAILLKDVDNLGHKGSLVVVSKGYLRNYLLPRKLAQVATASSIAAAEIAYEAAAAERAQAADDSQALADLLSSTTLTITASAGEDGRLFGSVTPQDIADAVLEARAVEIDKRKIRLEAPIKETGSHSIEIDLAIGIRATVTVIVAAQ
ncbi:unannotated protein [freshwater metagenome]|uniref:Unannotated protein n=1 Tax=freshwater metagenome TaxID=449393 RepID=A0A6J5Z3K8_9ZZZZ|nr:50S ribosomal protein L9 [Actinomycetota bacterium]MSX11013.1 50S ribosomal protein L9 [Actinomycetota bacterium]